MRFIMRPAVFEGIRCYGGNIFELRQHTERLFEGAKTMDFEIPYSADEIDAACNELLQKNGIEDGYIRPIAWRGPGMMGVSLRILAFTWRLRHGSGRPISRQKPACRAFG